MKSITMEVSKKENGAYVKVGDVEVFYPLLNELGINIEATGEDDKGFATYEDERVQYVYDAVVAAVKASARNKLVSGTVELKDGNKIAETIEELLAAGERSGAALALRREFFADLKAFMPTSAVCAGKSQAFVAGLFDLIQNVKGICNQSPARKNLINEVIAGLIGSLTAEKLAKYERTLAQIAEQVEAVSELPD